MFQNYAMNTMYAMIRLLHASPDTPAVDIYANGNLIAQNFAFGQLTEYVCVMPGMYQLAVYPAGTLAVPMISITVAVGAKMNATIALAGLLQNVSLMVIQEPPVFLTYANSYVRMAHLSPNMAAVDLVVNGTILLQNVSYGMITDYIALNPGTYTFELRAAGTDQVLLTMPDVIVRPGVAYTAFAIGLVNWTPPLELLMAFDANSIKR